MYPRCPGCRFPVTHAAAYPPSRASRAEQPSLTRALAWGPLTYLGAISFPIFVLHGPLGQLLYKKVIASLFFWQPYNSRPEGSNDTPFTHSLNACRKWVCWVFAKSNKDI